MLGTGFSASSAGSSDVILEHASHHPISRWQTRQQVFSKKIRFPHVQRYVCMQINLGYAFVGDCSTQKACRYFLTRGRGDLRRHLGRDFDAHADLMLAAADKDALDGAHVAVVAAPGDRNVRVVHEAIVGGIEINPAERSTPERGPGMRCIRANQTRLARYW